MFTAVAGLLIVFSGRSLVMRLLLRPPETEVSTLLLFLMRELSGLALMLSVLFFFASRDPVRNVAIVNGLIVGLCILAITPLLSLYTLDVRRLYPGYLIWSRSLKVAANSDFSGKNCLRIPLGNEFACQWTYGRIIGNYVMQAKKALVNVLRRHRRIPGVTNRLRGPGIAAC